MNKTRLRMLARAILRETKTMTKLGIGFNMGMFKAPRDEYTRDMSAPTKAEQCGTVCCIAGMAVVYAIKPEKRKAALRPHHPAFLYASMAAQEWLGLDDNTADELFYANQGRVEELKSIETITAKQAANTIYRLIKTGEVDWSKRRVHCRA